MNVKFKRLALAIVITASLLSFAMTGVKIAFSEGTGGDIDLFTQKEPYNGQGSNITSDAFGPGEQVEIFAQVTYNGYPVQGVLVSFEIEGPHNSVANLTFWRVAITNGTGIAAMNFGLSYANETVFGEWLATGSAQLGNSTFQDTVTFRVGWVVEIVSIRTVNDAFEDQQSFERGGIVMLELSLRNIAMTEKEVTLAVTVFDLMNGIVNSTELAGGAVQPDGTLVHFYIPLYIPKTTRVGAATVHVCALATIGPNRVAYSPEVTRTFPITEAAYTLTITVTAGGTTNPSPGTYSFMAGAVAQVTAIPDENYVFDGWELDNVDVGSSNPYVVQMDADHTLRAVFSQAPAKTFTPYYLYWVLVTPLLVLIVTVVLVWSYRRRKKEQEEFYSGWTAWYYGYDLRFKVRKS